MGGGSAISRLSSLSSALSSLVGSGSSSNSASNQPQSDALDKTLVELLDTIVLMYHTAVHRQLSKVHINLFPLLSPSRIWIQAFVKARTVNPVLLLTFCFSRFTVLLKQWENTRKPWLKPRKRSKEPQKMWVEDFLILLMLYLFLIFVIFCYSYYSLLFQAKKCCLCCLHCCFRGKTC